MAEKHMAHKRRTNENTLSRTIKVFGKIIGNLIFGIMLLLVALLVFSLVHAKVSGGPPAVAGQRMYIVLSGSMNPAFDAGSLVFVKPSAPEEIKDGDIITYRGLGEREQLISHRVIGVDVSQGGIAFTTKGDANEAVDPNPVTGKNLVGKVTLAIPYLGYFMEYSKTKQGIVFLVLIPASILLLWEVVSLFKYRRKTKQEKTIDCADQGETNNES